MIQEVYQKAIRFAGEKHKDQKVPGSDSNYLRHISNVAMEVLVAYSEKQDFDIEFAIQLALLHDTLEDTQTEFEELKEEFGEKVAIGVSALSKNKELPSKSEQIRDSLNRINALAKEVGIVKLADRITNLQAPPAYWDQNKILKYRDEAEVISTSLSGKNEYLNSRLLKKIIEYNRYLS